MATDIGARGALPRWVAALPGIACLALALLPEGAQGWLAWQRDAVSQGQLWRLWTGHLAHFGTLHAATGTVALLLIGSALRRRDCWRWLLVLVLGAPLLSLAMLIAAPDLGDYRGASGLVVASLAWLLTGLAARGSRGAAIAVVVLAVGIAAETLGFALPASTLPEGVRTAWQAHAFGALLGLAAWAIQYASNAGRWPGRHGWRGRANCAVSGARDSQ